MWKLFLLAAFVCGAFAQGSGPIQFLEQNLTAVWGRLHEIEDGGSCSPQITMHVVGPHRRGHHGGHGGHGHHSGSEEDGEHQDHDGSDEHGPRSHHGGSAHVHIHLDVGMGRPFGIYHSNPLPWADQIPMEYVHSICHMHSGSHDISGDIHLRQRFVGHDDVEMDFNLAGFAAGAHEHTFFVHRYGNMEDSCSHLGAVFTPPHRFGRGHGSHSGSDEHEDDHGHGHGHGHHSGERGEEGVLGAMSSDENGEMHGIHEFRTVTLIGSHRIVGRSIAVHQADDTDGTGTPLACCVVVMTDGSHFGDESGAWLPGEHHDE